MRYCYESVLHYEAHSSTSVRERAPGGGEEQLVRNTRTQQRRPTLELRLDIFLDLSGVPQGRVPRGRSMLCYMILLHDICYRTFSLLHAN